MEALAASKEEEAATASRLAKTGYDMTSAEALAAELAAQAQTRPQLACAAVEGAEAAWAAQGKAAVLARALLGRLPELVGQSYLTDAVLGAVLRAGLRRSLLTRLRDAEFVGRRGAYRLIEGHLPGRLERQMREAPNG